MEENPYTPSSSGFSSDEPKKKGGFMSIIKKILIGFGVAFALIILLFVWAAISTSETYDKFDGLAEPFIEDFIQNQDPWNYELAKPSLSREWLEVTEENQGIKLFNYFNKLGSLKSLESISWQGCSSQTHTSSGSYERCDYFVAVNYENDKAQVHFGLSLEEDQVKIMQLQINADVFIE